jgi:hypothetical protein
VGHKLEVVNQVLVFASGIFFKLLELLLEDLEVDLELRLVLITLSLNLVLQFCQRVGLFVLV